MSTMVIREAMTLLLVGVAVGSPIALGASSVVRSLLFGVTVADGMTVSASLGAIFVIAAAAPVLPARRVFYIQPAEVLKAQ